MYASTHICGIYWLGSAPRNGVLILFKCLLDVIGEPTVMRALKGPLCSCCKDKIVFYSLERFMYFEASGTSNKLRWQIISKLNFLVVPDSRCLEMVSRSLRLAENTWHTH